MRGHTHRRATPRARAARGRAWAADLVAGVGLSSVVAGLWMAWPPAALIAGGGLLVAIAVGARRLAQTRKDHDDAD